MSAAEQPPETEHRPRGRRRWGLSPLDWRSHVIDDRRDHPIGVLKAECGHLLMMVTTLHEAPCDACAAQQLDSAVIHCQGQ